MKLIRFGERGRERPGMMDANGRIRDLSGIVPDISGPSLDPATIAGLKAIEPAKLPTIEGSPRIGACVGGVGKLVCIGLNYADHAAESGLKVPSEPIVFMKATTSICGPNDPLEIPRRSHKTDWEVELGVVIGTRAKYVEEANSMSHVAGYCTVNDVSEREFQAERQGQWTKGKSHDSFGPIGPWLVTADEIPDPQSLKLWCEVDGKRWQDGSTKTMVYGVKMLIAYVSQFMTLEPGDVIATGTPPGVGSARNPPILLKAGDRMTCTYDGVGTLTNPVVAPQAAGGR